MFQLPNDSNIDLFSGLCTNCATAKPSSETFPYFPFSMKMICAPSQVMREGKAWNQQGHGALQEQASSRSPLMRHLVGLSAALTVSAQRTSRTGVMAFMFIV